MTPLNHASLDGVMANETNSAPQAASAARGLAPAAEHLIRDVLKHMTTDSACLWVGCSQYPPPNSALQPTADAASTMHWTCCTPEALLNESWQKRYALAITDLPAELSPKQALHLLARLRDLHARQVLAFVPIAALGWHEADLLALGMQRQARYHHHDELMEAWSFDIKTYKAVPDWLNPRFWANPEKWDRFRW